MRDTLIDTLKPLGIALGAARVALVVVQGVRLILLWVGRRSALLTELANRAHRPTQWVVVLSAIYFSIRGTATEADWRNTFLHVEQLLIIGTAAWLVAGLLVVAEDAALARFRTDVPDNRQA